MITLFLCIPLTSTSTYAKAFAVVPTYVSNRTGVAGSSLLRGRHIDKGARLSKFAHKLSNAKATIGWQFVDIVIRA